ncbi:DUF6266 family protein [Algoriphagus sp. CAU 1675]|uniref:DUF6266 family protein n=1 Tax=Algoriphagus sp. CAU 1675 TaxID=3032597 RepID=UPI0023DA8C27|nr:DUF6266 family protein [Algoriphagus sp. CAU 1675]MDF2159437.1 DUF6266 family protein [Algoriphagus sp. CAU 1675]
MATSSNPLLKNFSGKIGDLVIYQLNGKTVIRKRPEPKSVYRPSKLQVFNQNAFKEVQQFLLPLREVLDFGYSEYIQGFKKGIHHATSWALKKAITGDGNKVILHKKSVKISSGDLPLPSGIEASWVGTGQLKITWDSEGSLGLARMTDYSYVVLYHQEEKKVLEIREGSHRSKESHLITVPEIFQDSGVLVFLAFYKKVSGSKVRFSDSICLELE